MRWELPESVSKKKLWYSFWIIWSVWLAEVHLIEAAHYMTGLPHNHVTGVFAATFHIAMVVGSWCVLVVNIRCFRDD